MAGETGDFNDWEVLHNSDTAPVNSSDSTENPRSFEVIEGDSEGMIRSDYFSLDNQVRTHAQTVADVSEEGSVESDNPSWIDPVPETRYERKNSGEFWSDSASDRSEDRKFNDFDAKNELGLLESTKIQVGVEGIGEIQTLEKDSGKFWSDTGGDGLVSVEFGEVRKETEMSFGDFEGENSSITELEGEGENSAANESAAIEEVKSNPKSEGGGEKVAWWKVPLEVLKYCALRVSPVWTFSVAAAVLGFVILGRRLYKMKRRSQSLQLKVTMDDKKVSQFMSRAARLNEAFSVVRRVPIVRPALPAPGVTPWPVMSLR
ncbi:hypothetical protein UlMin_021339 [Ulmus minor]